MRDTFIKITQKLPFCLNYLIASRLLAEVSHFFTQGFEISHIRILAHNSPKLTKTSI